MRKVQRWRYYCDFCKKAGNSGFHMRNHEASCTLNPARVCKLCPRIGEVEQADMAAMLALLPDPAQFMETIPAQYERGFLNEPLCVAHEYTRINEEAFKPLLVPAMLALRKLANDCPICILAALRQKKIPVPIVDGFDFKSELSDTWAEINQNEAEYA